MSAGLRQACQLDWQSRLLIAAVAPFCAAAVLGYAVATCTAETRNALLVSLLLAASAWLARATTPPAAIAGGILSAAMFLFPARPDSVPWFHSAVPPLVMLVLLTFAATRFGERNKERLGVAENRRGRGAGQIVANLGFAGIVAAIPLAVFAVDDLRQIRDAFPTPETGRLISWSTMGAVMIVAALAEAAADTLASELGEVLGGEPFLIIPRKRVAPGTDGAVSVAGTLAGGSGALCVVLLAVPALRLSLAAAFAAAAGAVGGLFFDSLLGATAERRGRLNNDAVNFLSTVAAAAFALAILAATRLVF